MIPVVIGSIQLDHVELTSRSRLAIIQKVRRFGSQSNVSVHCGPHVDIGDAINTGLLIAAVAGIALTFWQVRTGVRTQRAQFLNDLYSRLVSDRDIAEAYYLIEYGQFKYSADFHGSDVEPKIDRLLGFVDLVAELHLQGVIADREMTFFHYRFRRLISDPSMRAYLHFLGSIYQDAGVSRKPFSSFQAVASKTSPTALKASVRED
jgi:hypothetical protein